MIMARQIFFFWPAPKKFAAHHWFKRFKEGLGGLEDGPRCGEPSAPQTSGTAAEVEFVATDRQTTLKLMVHKLCINVEMFRQIIHGRFGNE